MRPNDVDQCESDAFRVFLPVLPQENTVLHQYEVN
jgi:hypothetical protein